MAVFGLGAVGLAVIQGAKMAGARYVTRGGELIIYLRLDVILTRFDVSAASLPLISTKTNSRMPLRLARRTASIVPNWTSLCKNTLRAP